MQKKTMKWKRFFAAVLSAVMTVGSVTGGMFQETVHAAENAASAATGSEEKNWYVLGRPMTEEEKEEQYQIIEQYQSVLDEIPEEGQTVPVETRVETPISFMSSGTDAVKTTESLPWKYSSVEEGYTPAVRNQSPHNNCWAHASTAAVEISMIKNQAASKEDVNLSEAHLIYYICRPVTDPMGGTDDQNMVIYTDTVASMFANGGFIYKSVGPLLSWMGPVSEGDFYDYNYLYENHNEPTQLDGLNDADHAYGNKAALVVETVEVSKNQRDEMKRAIMEYGALAIDYNSGSRYFNADFAAQYCGDYVASNHAVVIVGWDDTFPKENFNTTPSGDGAWLVRNSWGESHGDGGYFWLSYYDNSMSGGRAYKAVSSEKYDNNYRYDNTGNEGGYVNGVEEGSIESVNVFEIQNDKELLKAVQFGIQWINSKYSIQIYKNPENPAEPDTGEPLLEEPIQGTKVLTGRYTADLGKIIELEKGDKIAVSVTYTSDNPTVVPAAPTENGYVSLAGRSMYRVNDGQWIDCAEKGIGNFLIRAFTSNITEEAHTHDWDSAWSYNDQGHWHECNGEGTCTSDEGRAYAVHTGGEANCSARAICEICENPYGQKNTEVHSGGKVRRNMVAATTSQKGYTGDICCSGCGLVLEPGEEIPMLTEEEAAKPKQVPNLEYTFTSLEGQEVSSKAEGKPKLIFFYGASCGGCINTLEAFTKKEVDGADFVAVEVKQSAQQAVAAFRDSLGVGKDNMKFCYDEEYEASQARIAYEKAFHGMTYSSLPVLCYIDENDQITHMTSGAQSLEEIKSNLALYCKVKTTNLNMDNPSEATFTTLDGEEISLAADGRPKVLIFFDNAYYSQQTLMSVSANNLSGVDVYGLNFMQNEEDTKTFVKNFVHSGSNIKFAQGESVLWQMLAYTGAIGVSALDSTPVIAYIDGENKLQNVTMGPTTFDIMKLNLMSSCGYIEPTEDDKEDEEEPDKPVEPEVKDTTVPEASYQINEGIWEKFTEANRIAVFSKDTQVMRIKASDADSGVDTVEYYVSDENVDADKIQTWTAYEEDGIAFRDKGTYFVYVRVTDKAGNTAVLCSEGIVIYEESSLSETSLEYTEELGEERSVQLNLNGNTFGRLCDSAGTVVNAENYKVTAESDRAVLTLKAEYLDSLAAGEYTYKVFLNPQGLETDQAEVSCSFEITVKEAENETPDIPDIPDVPEDPEEGILRIAGADRNKTSYLVADALKAELGLEKFDTVIVATGRNFADALSGSYLAVQKNAPILLTNSKEAQAEELYAYIKDNLKENGQIYILGGESAVSAEIENALAEHYTVKRISGASRYETSLAILAEAGVEEGGDLIVATGKNFADSLSASAVKRPIMLVKPGTVLNDVQKELAAKAGKIYIVGGNSAVTEETEAELASLGDVKRIAGSGRQETSRMIAEEFFGEAKKVVVAQAMDFPDGLCGGQLAAAMDAPLLLTRDGKTEAAESYVRNAGIRTGVVLGGTGAITDETVNVIFNK